MKLIRKVMLDMIQQEEARLKNIRTLGTIQKVMLDMIQQEEVRLKNTRTQGTIQKVMLDMIQQEETRLKNTGTQGTIQKVKEFGWAYHSYMLVFTRQLRMEMMICLKTLPLVSNKITGVSERGLKKRLQLMSMLSFKLL